MAIRDAGIVLNGMNLDQDKIRDKVIVSVSDRYYEEHQKLKNTLVAICVI